MCREFHEAPDNKFVTPPKIKLESEIDRSGGYSEHIKNLVGEESNVKR